MRRLDSLTWEELRHEFLGSHPRQIALNIERSVFLFWQPAYSRLGLRIPDDSPRRELPGFHALQSERRTHEGEPWIELSVTNEDLFLHLFGLALTVAEAVDVHDNHVDAVESALQQWSRIIGLAARLSPEKEVGLLGELHVLSEIMDRHATSNAVAAWTGHASAHDFRLGAVEVEVKTTTAERRSHVISSETQIKPSTGFDLWVYSVQLTPAGAGSGFSLRTVVSRVDERLGGRDRERFRASLESWGVTMEQVETYDAVWKMRDHPALVPVDETFPRITLSRLGDELGLDVSRIADLRYRVDLTGLGHAPGEAEFEAVMRGERP